MIKSLINRAIAILEATVPKLKIGFRLLVYYPPKKDYHLATVSMIESNKITLLFDTGESVPYLIDSKNIIGKGVDTLVKKPLEERGLTKYVKFFFVTPTTLMLQKVTKQLTFQQIKDGLGRKKVPSMREIIDHKIHEVKIDQPIYETIKKYSFHKYIPDDRHPSSSTNIDAIYKPRGTFKSDFNIHKFITELENNRPEIKIITLKENNAYCIKDTYQGGILNILLSDKFHKQASWYYS